MARSGRLASGAQSEASWQAEVEGLARFYGWRLFHAPDNKPVPGQRGRAAKQRVTPGFPDLVLVRVAYGPELLFVELKSDEGRIGPGQQEWLSDLGQVGDAVLRAVAGHVAEDRRPRVEAHIWRPSHWDVVNARLGRGHPTKMTRT